MKRRAPTRFTATDFRPQRFFGWKERAQSHFATPFVFRANRKLVGGQIRSFVNFYRSLASELAGFEAREHTAQVPYEDRLIREDRFRTARTAGSLLLADDGAGRRYRRAERGEHAERPAHSRQLCPAQRPSWSQRSAGSWSSPTARPAVRTTSISSNARTAWFPARSRPPRLDLANEDLVRAHLHAIWLAEANLSLGSSLRDLLDVAGNDPTLATTPSVLDTLRRPQPRLAAHVRAKARFSPLSRTISKTPTGTPPHGPRKCSSKSSSTFEAACERWRNLCKAALAQQKIQNAIIMDMSRTADERRQAERLRREAESQYKLLTETKNVVQSDFYSYRYFASEGFLPGYNFPRLPLSAYIPAGALSREMNSFRGPGSLPSPNSARAQSSTTRGRATSSTKRFCL